MIEALVNFVLPALVGGALGWWAYKLGHRRKAARSFATRREVEFDGAVLGSTPYCRPVGGVLAVGDGTLTWLSGRGGKRYPVPLERLVAQRLERSRHRAGPKGPVTDIICVDQPTGTVVTLQVPTDDLPYLATVLPLPGVEPAVRPDPGRSILGR